MDDTLLLKDLKGNRFFDDLKYIFSRIKYEASLRRVRVVLVLNPRSSQAKNVEREVLYPINQYIFVNRKTSNVTILKFEVLPTDVDDNAERLASILKDEDIMLTIGGDGTATIGVNAAFLSRKRILYYTIPYGNFNDIARTTRRAKGKKVFALEARINDEHFRFAMCYFTVGMLAKSTEIFDEKRIRERLRKRKKNLLFSLFELFKWFIGNRRQKFIPEFKYKINSELNEGLECDRASDIVVLNGVSMARVLRGGDYFKRKTFLLRISRMQDFFRIGWFMIIGILWKVTGKTVNSTILYFDRKRNTGKMEIQAEGRSCRPSWPRPCRRARRGGTPG